MEQQITEFLRSPEGLSLLRDILVENVIVNTNTDINYECSDRYLVTNVDIFFGETLISSSSSSTQLSS